MKAYALFAVLCFGLLSCGKDGYTYDHLSDRLKDPAYFTPEHRSRADLTFEDFTVTQKLGPGTNETFEERVGYSKTFAAGPNSPVIYYLCGEWTCGDSGASWLMGDFARKLKAHLVWVEHRFYGQSGPKRPNGFTEADLGYLSTELAVEDFAKVQRKVGALKHLRGRWFSVGGSYAGTLAVYYRLAHPELASGAFAFSAPLQVDPRGLTGYEGVAIRAFGSGLDAKIRLATQFIFAQMGTAEGKAYLQKLMKLPDADFGAEDIAAILVNMIPEVSQAGKVSELSSAMISTKTGQEAAEALIGYLRGFFGDDFWIESPYGFRTDPKYQGPTGRWVYQAFSQYGWLYVTDKDSSLLPMPVTMDYYREALEKVFHGQVHLLQSPYSLKMLERFKTTGSRIVLFNGTIDPWISASLPDYQDPAHEMFARVATGGSHCVGMGALSSNPNDFYYPLQQFMLKKFRQWSR